MKMGVNLTHESQSTPRESNRSVTKEWKKLIAKYQHSNGWKAVWQIVNTLVPIAAIWVACYFLKDISLLYCIPLALLG